MLLPRRDVIVRLVSLPGVAAKDVEGALRLQLDSLHPYGEDEVVWGWSAAGVGRRCWSGSRGATTVERYHQLFTEAGIAVSVVHVFGGGGSRGGAAERRDPGRKASWR